MENDTLVQLIQKNTDAYIAALSSFDAQTFNKAPGPKIWTAGQLAEHLHLSESGIPNVLEDTVEHTDRNPSKKFDAIDAVFLDYSQKFQAPKSITPGNGPYEQQHMIDQAKADRQRLMHLARNLDLAKLCTSVPFPGMGEFTRLEWLHFMLSHATRHTKQLKDIKAAI
ncbi:DinB family protein [Chitinophaga skermanii]|uniref:DinB family protein n=1 Tax=Chitinophaga skermanii TaxID=331697 RepID=A0A327QN94_9BACT|nr:DinB family protein [Chitinophaga skermanii]RAJ05164.1 DinB family protein [Chitinophaga skermanii]